MTSHSSNKSLSTPLATRHLDSVFLYAPRHQASNDSLPTPLATRHRNSRMIYPPRHVDSPTSCDCLVSKSGHHADRGCELLKNLFRPDLSYSNFAEPYHQPSNGSDEPASLNLEVSHFSDSEDKDDEELISMRPQTGHSKTGPLRLHIPRTPSPHPEISPLEGWAPAFVSPVSPLIDSIGAPTPAEEYFAPTGASKAATALRETALQTAQRRFRETAGERHEEDIHVAIRQRVVFEETIALIPAPLRPGTRLPPHSSPIENARSSGGRCEF
jgi:hypothetical protein